MRDMALINTPQLTLNNDTTIPQLGFGTYLVAPDETEGVVSKALETGYRHIDTAQMYGNEEGVGAALAKSGLGRDEVYVTTKLDNANHEPADVRRSLEESLGKLGLDRVDLFLIHWPLPTLYGGDYVSTWKAMAALMAEGLASSVGVSNFQPEHIERIVTETGVVPAVNQIEVHPFFNNEAARKASRDRNILVEAWSPIAQGKVNDSDVLKEIAAHYGKTPAQIALRWHVERGDIVFPKSTRVERMTENAQIFDFNLSPEDVERISALDQGAEGRLGPDPDTFDYLGSAASE